MKNTDVFEQLGIARVINACGIYTDLGGSMLDPAVWAAMTEANECFTSMPDLLERTGTHIAALMGAQAARVTPGASAAIALSVGATMTGTVGTRWEQLPDTSGLRNEVLMFRSQVPRYKYASCVRMCGARIVEIGGEDGLDPDLIAAERGPNTACVMIPQHLTDWYEHPPPNLARICEVAHRCDLPVVVDAAYLNYPIDLFRGFTTAGADLVCFSAKYFNGPNAGGFVVGRADLMEAIAGLDFTGFESGEHRSFGRPFKMGRYEVIATTLALEQWIEGDHPARFASHARRVDTILGAVPAGAGVSATPASFTMDERLEAAPVNCAVLRFDPACDHTVGSMERALATGSPSIAAIAMEDALVLAVDAMTDEHAEIVAGRLESIFGGAR